MVLALALGAALSACSTTGDGTAPQQPAASTLDATDSTVGSDSPAEPETTAPEESEPPPEPGTIERYSYEVHLAADRMGVDWDATYSEFRQLVATQPLDEATAAEAGLLVRDIYRPLITGSHWAGEELFDAYIATKVAYLNLKHPATPKMVLAFDATLDPWAEIVRD